MERVEGEYIDYSAPNNKGYFKLKSDKDFNPFKWSPPIIWEGVVSRHKVKFVQTSDSGSNRNDYDFTGFPVEIEDAIDSIIEAINEAMRTMN